MHLYSIQLKRYLGNTCAGYASTGYPPAITRLVWLATVVVLFTSYTATAQTGMQATTNSTQTAPTSQQNTAGASNSQTVKIDGVTYATGVKLGLPIPVLIRAKALQEKTSHNKDLEKN